MLKKLRILSLIDLCMTKQELTYAEIAKACGLENKKDDDFIEQIETLVLEAYQNQLIECRID